MLKHFSLKYVLHLHVPLSVLHSQISKPASWKPGDLGGLLKRGLRYLDVRDPESDCDIPGQFWRVKRDNTRPQQWFRDTFPPKVTSS